MIKTPRTLRARERLLTNHSETSEKALEKYLIQKSAAAGLRCLKYSNCNEAGYPDRILVLPGMSVVWVELKSLGKKPTALQLRRHSELEALGHCVWVVDRREQIDNLLNAFMPHEVQTL